MNLIAHRRNTVAELQSTPPQYGVEIDLRSHGQKLIVQHDPFAHGEDFEHWLDHFRHGTLILNVKEEGLVLGADSLMELELLLEKFTAAFRSITTVSADWSGDQGEHPAGLPGYQFIASRRVHGC